MRCGAPERETAVKKGIGLAFLIALAYGCSSTGTQTATPKSAMGGAAGTCEYCMGSGICTACDDSAKCAHCKGTTTCWTCMGDGYAGGKVCPECNGAKECSHCTPMGVMLHCPACNSSSYCPHCEGSGTVSAP